MKKQIPGWQFGAIVTVIVIGVLWLLGRTTTPAQPSLPPEVQAQVQAHTGKPIADFSGPTGDGKTFKLSENRGKLVLLNFWATWCGPCREEIPDLIKVQDKYRDKGLVIVGLSQDDQLKTAQDFAKKQGINYPVLLCTAEVAQELGVQALPTSVLLDRDGKVVWMGIGVNPTIPVADVLSEQIDKVL